MLHELRNQAVNAFKSGQVLLCSYKRKQYLLLDVDLYWSEASLLRNTPQAIANYNANSFAGGEELCLDGFDAQDLKVLGFAPAP